MNKKNTKQKEACKKFSPQFKDQALERASKNGIPQTALDLGIIALMSTRSYWLTMA